MLRDIVMNISNGIKKLNFEGLHVSIVDERGEIAALYRGIPQNNIGIRTDIADSVSKSIGIKMLIRSMSPQVIAADEIGTKEDIEAIEEAVASGIKGIFTAHGNDKNDLIKNPILNELINLNYIQKVIFLKREQGIRNIEVEEEVC